MKFQFGNVVVVEKTLIGVIVKSWEDETYYVYVRFYNEVGQYHENEIKHYIYSKEIIEDEAELPSV